MKKFTLLVAFIGMITLQSCTVHDEPQTINNVLEAEVFELRNVNFTNNGGNQFSIYQTLNPQILQSDVILIYRLSGTIDSSTPIWQPIPRTLYLPQGELDYDFDFSREDFTIYAGGTYDLTLTPSYITNETFRIVIVPGYFSNRLGKGKMEQLSYEEAVELFKINESKILKIN